MPAMRPILLLPLLPPPPVPPPSCLSSFPAPSSFIPSLAPLLSPFLLLLSFSLSPPSHSPLPLLPLSLLSSFPLVLPPLSSFSPPSLSPPLPSLSPSPLSLPLSEAGTLAPQSVKERATTRERERARERELHYEREREGETSPAGHHRAQTREKQRERERLNQTPSNPPLVYSFPSHFVCAFLISPSLSLNGPCGVTVEEKEKASALAGMVLVTALDVTVLVTALDVKVLVTVLARRLNCPCGVRRSPTAIHPPPPPPPPPPPLLPPPPPPLPPPPRIA